MLSTHRSVHQASDTEISLLDPAGRTPKNWGPLFLGIAELGPPQLDPARLFQAGDDSSARVSVRRRRFRMCWSELRKSLEAGRLEGTSLAEELITLLRRHTTRFPLDLADESVSHDEGRAALARGLETLAARGEAVSYDAMWGLHEQVKAVCVEPLFYDAPAAADGLSRGLICGLSWLELTCPDNDARDATQFVKAHVAQPPAWLSPRLAEQV
jgi:hypothetical protein